jgi:HEAT repeat protein
MARRSKGDDATVERQLADLDDLPADRAQRSRPLADALAGGHYRVVAKAARLTGDALLYDLVPALLAAYRRFLVKPIKSDPNCYAKKAIVRALVALDCEDVDFFLAGLKLEQREPVWGGTADTAADVRGTCALGLVATGHPRALVPIAALLYDPEPDARVGAVRAAANGTPREAELLLRSKALAGDDVPAILGECFSALMSVEPEGSLAFVAQWLAKPDDALRELAALALGESRVPAALDALKTAWTQPVVADELRFTLIRAASAHRSEAAFDWLLSIAADSRSVVAARVIESLEPYKNNARLGERLRSVLAARGDPDLEQDFETRWGRARAK